MRKKRKSFEIPEHLKKVSGIKLVDLKSIQIQICPYVDQAILTCEFDGLQFCLSLLDGKIRSYLYLPEVAVSAEVSGLGWNPNTKKPQIAWKKGKPRKELAFATDVAVAVLFGMMHPYDPSLIAPTLTPKKPRKKTRK